MPSIPRRAGTRLDVPGAIVLFTGLLCLIGSLLFGRDLHWAPWIWLVMMGGVAIVAAFVLTLVPADLILTGTDPNLGQVIQGVLLVLVVMAGGLAPLLRARARERRVHAA